MLKISHLLRSRSVGAGRGQNGECGGIGRGSHQRVVGHHHLPQLAAEKSDWPFECDGRSSNDKFVLPALFNQCQWVSVNGSFLDLRDVACLHV